MPPCGSSPALFFLASSFLVSHPIFYFHTPSWPSVPVSLSSPSLPNFPAFPSLPTFYRPLLPPFPQFPIFRLSSLFYLQTTTHLITHITTSLQSAKYESRITYEQVNLLNVLELPQLSTEHYTISELAYNLKIFYRLHQSHLWRMDLG